MTKKVTETTITAEQLWRLSRKYSRSLRETQEVKDEKTINEPDYFPRQGPSVKVVQYF